MNKENEKYKIGIVGPINSCMKIKELILENHSLFGVYIYPSEKIASAHELLEEAEFICDGLIFTGIGVYFSVKERYEIKKPNVYIDYGYDSILKALWSLQKKYPKVKEFSIDTVGDEEVEYLMNEFEMKNLVAHVLPYSKNLLEEDYLSFHKKIIEKNESTISISGFDWVYNQLKNENLRCVRLYAIKKGILNKVEELLHMMRLKDEQDSSICIQIFQIMTGTDDGSSPYRSLEIGADFKVSLVEYLKKIKGSVFPQGWDKYIIFSTLGAVRVPENQYELKSMLISLEKKSIRVAVGIGVGKSAYESEFNANKALNLAKQEKRNSIYEITPREIRGPLLEERMVNIEPSKLDSKYEKISEKAKVSILTVERIRNLTNRKNGMAVTSEEIALELDTTIRNANRVIKKFLEAGLCEICDISSSNRAGRPKKLIKFLF